MMLDREGTRKRILVVFGTRPEAIKLAPVIYELSMEKSFDTRVCITAQHRDMLDGVIETFGMDVYYDLDIMREGQDLFDVGSAVLRGMRGVLEDFVPDLVMVHGDTSTTLFASLSALYARVDVAHVEAGLRSGDILSPWPEEANRQLTARIAKYHFTPSVWSRKNLVEEGIDADSVIVTGNTVLDSLSMVVERIRSDGSFLRKILIGIEKAGYSVSDGKRVVLVTGHRRENFGEGMENICQAILKLSKRYPDVDFVYPVHPNPNIRGVVKRILGDVENIHIVEPLEYSSFVYMMMTSSLIMTDSGGVQEEAPSLGVPVVLMRDTTERPELIENGMVVMAGTKAMDIYEASREILDMESGDAPSCSPGENPYGEGGASRKIVEFLKGRLS